MVVMYNFASACLHQHVLTGLRLCCWENAHSSNSQTAKRFLPSASSLCISHCPHWQQPRVDDLSCVRSCPCATLIECHQIEDRRKLSDTTVACWLYKIVVEWVKQPEFFWKMKLEGIVIADQR